VRSPASERGFSFGERIVGRRILVASKEPVAPLDSGCEAIEDRRAPRPEEKPMDDLAIRRRVEHTIRFCRAFDIEPDARTVAEIMTDEDSGGAVYEDRPLAFDEYEKAARRVLRRPRVNRRSA
jgi:hypothetical protein